jgi:hypothetical protein
MLPPTDLRSREAPMTATDWGRKRGSNEEGIRRGVQLLAGQLSAEALERADRSRRKPKTHSREPTAD